MFELHHVSLFPSSPDQRLLPLFYDDRTFTHMRGKTSSSYTPTPTNSLTVIRTLVSSRSLSAEYVCITSTATLAWEGLTAASGIKYDGRLLCVRSERRSKSAVRCSSALGERALVTCTSRSSEMPFRMARYHEQQEPCSGAETRPLLDWSRARLA